MTKAQWKAINDYCDELDCTKHELLTELKENGTIERGARIEDLGNYVTRKDYDTMLKFLEENLL